MVSEIQIQDTAHSKRMCVRALASSFTAGYAKCGCTGKVKPSMIARRVKDSGRPEGVRVAVSAACPLAATSQCITLCSTVLRTLIGIAQLQAIVCRSQIQDTAHHSLGR